MLPLDGSIEAEYSDGYIHSETKLNDTSPYVVGKNVFNDVLEKRPEAEHGRMVRFSVYYKNHRYDVDWSDLPDNARPIRFKHMERDFDPECGWLGEARLNRLDFGYQYTDNSGRNIQEVEAL